MVSITGKYKYIDLCDPLDFSPFHIPETNLTNKEPCDGKQACISVFERKGNMTLGVSSCGVFFEGRGITATFRAERQIPNDVRFIPSERYMRSRWIRRSRSKGTNP